MVVLNLNAANGSFQFSFCSFLSPFHIHFLLQNKWSQKHCRPASQSSLYVLLTHQRPLLHVSIWDVLWNNKGVPASGFRASCQRPPCPSPSTTAMRIHLLPLTFLLSSPSFSSSSLQHVLNQKQTKKKKKIIITVYTLSSTTKNYELECCRM